mgnify:FL=1
MSNDHAKDRYDPPSVGSEFDEDRFSEINPGEVFRLFRDNDSKIYRKTNDNFALDLKEGVEIQCDSNEKIYVKS